MKVYITGHFDGKAEQPVIEGLSNAVRRANMKDFCFVRDIEQYKPTFDDQKERWERVYDELGACDALLVDVSGLPPGQNVIECGMAFAMRKPVILAVKKGKQYKNLFGGIAATVIEYDHYKDIVQPLKTYDKDRLFTITDKAMLFTVLLAVGGATSWVVAQLLVPAVPVWAIIYWLIVRRLFVSMRDFDRIVIYIPLAAVWAAGLVVLQQVSMALAWGWAVGFWLVALVVIQKLKFSL